MSALEAMANNGIGVELSDAGVLLFWPVTPGNRAFVLEHKAQLLAELFDPPRNRVLVVAACLGWPLVGSFVPPVIALLGLPAGKMGSPGPRASWEGFLEIATAEQAAELERLLVLIVDRRHEAERAEARRQAGAAVEAPR